MTQHDFHSAFQSVAAGDAPPSPLHPDYIAAQIVRRDRRRTRLLAALTIVFALIATAGLLLLVLGLNRLVIFLRIQNLPASPGWDSEDRMFWGTDLVHHSMPLIAVAVVALLLAALCTVLLIFSSRQATLNSISLSLSQLTAELRQMRQPGGAASGAAFSAPPPPSPAPHFDSRIQLMPVHPARRWAGWIALCVLGLLALAAYHVYQTNRQWSGYPRQAPYEAIRWTNQTPDVRINGKWYELQEINGLPVEQIVAYSKFLDYGAWQKHFNEDLVELMDLMGHEPGDTVDLQVRDLTTSATQTLRNVPMTEANRAAIWQAWNMPQTLPAP